MAASAVCSKAVNPLFIMFSCCFHFVAVCFLSCLCLVLAFWCGFGTLFSLAILLLRERERVALL